MKIEKVTQVVSYLIETDNKEFHTFRRNSKDDWEVLMGESWEPIYTYPGSSWESKIKGLEEQFQDHIFS